MYRSYPFSFISHRSQVGFAHVTFDAFPYEAEPSFPTPSVPFVRVYTVYFVLVICIYTNICMCARVPRVYIIYPRDRGF